MHIQTLQGALLQQELRHLKLRLWKRSLVGYEAIAPTVVLVKHTFSVNYHNLSLVRAYQRE